MENEKINNAIGIFIIQLSKCKPGDIKRRKDIHSKIKYLTSVNRRILNLKRIKNAYSSKIKNVDSSKIKNVDSVKIKNVDSSKIKNVDSVKIKNVDSSKIKNVDSANKIYIYSANKRDVDSAKIKNHHIKMIITKLS